MTPEEERDAIRQKLLLAYLSELAVDLADVDMNDGWAGSEAIYETMRYDIEALYSQIDWAELREGERGC